MFGHASFGHRVSSAVRTALLSIAATVVGIAPLLAQPAVTVSIGRAFSTFSATQPDIAARQATGASVEAEHQFAGARLRLFYDMDAGTFSTEGDWHYSLHSAGATYRIPFGAEERNTVFLTASGILRANGIDWGAADFRAIELRANVQMQPRQTATVRFGYRFDARTFPDLSPLNQLEHDGFVSVLVNFATRTTVIGEVHAGVKSYQAYSLTVPANQVPSDITVLHSGGYGRGMGPGLRASTQTLIAPGSQALAQDTHAEQISWLARVAQSVTDRIGVALQLAQRARFGQVPPVLITTPTVFFDDGVYDDPFASNALAVSAGAKRQFQRGVVLEGSASLTAKDYAGAVPLDIQGLPITGALRSDRIVRAGIGAIVPLFPAKTGRLGLDLNLDYLLVRHRSNDAFYNYTSHGAGVGVTVSY